jgi:hypothetical protein
MSSPSGSASFHSPPARLEEVGFVQDLQVEEFDEVVVQPRQVVAAQVEIESIV